VASGGNANEYKFLEKLIPPPSQVSPKPSISRRRSASNPNHGAANRAAAAAAAAAAEHHAAHHTAHHKLPPQAADSGSNFTRGVASAPGPGFSP
jgi:hypothetical protein